MTPSMRTKTYLPASPSKCIYYKTNKKPHSVKNVTPQESRYNSYVTGRDAGQVTDWVHLTP